MAEWKEALLGAAKERWHTKVGLFAALIVVAASLIAAFAGIDLAEVSVAEWIVVLGACGVIFFVWYRTRLPRARAGRVGFGVAIDSEDNESSERARADLIQALRDNLHLIWPGALSGPT
jgi:hypothetical protein